LSLLKNKLTFTFLYAALALVIIYVMTSGSLGISVDSENYLNIAHRFTEHLWGTAFNPVWPPAYPLSIAVIKALGVAELVGAAQAVAIISFVILVVTVFLLGLRLQGKLTAHFSAISTLFFASLIYIYCYAWSETLYIMFSLLFFLMLILLLKAPPEKMTEYLIGSGIFAGLGTVSRLVGFSLIGTGILSILFLSNYHPKSKRLKKTLVFMLVSGIPVLFHYLTCFYYYGLRGKTQWPSKYSFSHQLSQFFLTIYHDFLSFDLSFWKYVFLLGSGFPLFWIRTIVLFCSFIFLILFFKVAFSARLPKEVYKFPIIVIFYSVLYGSIILLVSLTVAIDPIGSRFTSPLYPLFLLLAFSFVFQVCNSFTQQKIKRLLWVIAILGTVSFWAIQITSCLSIYKGIRSGSFPTMEQPGNLNRGSITFLKENVDSSDMIITNIYRKLDLLWPRREPYPDIPKEDWEKNLKAVTYEASQRTVYILICSEDFAPYGITVEDMDTTNEKIGLFSWKKIFGNDYVYKTKHVIFQKPPEMKKEE
jgi:4-amino-4-deoxy-L-arabinose transferase-like glycosyltransferase